MAALERQRRLENVLRQKRELLAQSESITDQEMVDNIFGFLPSMVGGQEGQAPVGFEVSFQKLKMTALATSGDQLVRPVELWVGLLVLLFSSPGLGR